MVPFVFKLAKGIKLTEEADKYYITSQTPIRYLRLNRSLFELIKQVSSGCSLDEITSKKTPGQCKQIVELVFSMVSKGFLEYNCDVDFNLENKDMPRISIIIPVRNRPDDIGDCLKSIKNLDYPKEKLEIIVVDDGSTDDTVHVIQSYGVKLICNAFSMGPGKSRNLGEIISTGEILAFLDSDCKVSSDWLAKIVPFFSLPGIGAVGGFVAGYFKASTLDRYEDAFSSLNMGRRIIFNNQAESRFYVPSCNFFVRREVFQELNGFNSHMQVGEDVDFCWRLRDGGYHLLYVPYGVVYHKHRNRLLIMLKRRFDYGTSEASLYTHHSGKKKVFLCPLNQGLSIIVVLWAILARSLLPLWFLGSFFGADFLTKKRLLTLFSPTFSNSSIALSILRSTFNFWYSWCFYLIRYYLLLIILLVYAFPTLGLFLIFILLISSTVDYFLKKPQLSYLSFLSIYVLEHSFYQSGVFYGCVIQSNYWCLFPKISLLIKKPKSNLQNN